MYKRQDPHRPARGRVQYGRALVQDARVNPQVGEPPGRRRRHLEGEGRERLRRIGRALLLRAVRHPPYGRHVGGRRQVRQDRVQQGLDPAVAVRRAAQHHHAISAERQLPQGAGQGFPGQRRRRAELLQGIGMQLRHRLLQEPAPPLRLLAQRFGDRALLVGVGVGVPVQRAHPQQVDDTGERVLRPDGQLDYQGHGAQPVADRRDRRVEVGARPVQLVDERDPRHTVPVRLRCV